MPNVSPINFDKLTQVRTSPEFRDRLKEMGNATGCDASELIRRGFDELYARWRKCGKKRA